MSTTSIIMMSVTLGFYFLGFIYLVNRAFNVKNEEV